MVLETSAIVAIVLRETGYERLTSKMDGANHVIVGTPTLFEAEMVLVGRLGDRGREAIRSLLERTGAVPVPFTVEHYRAATEAWLRYGKGRHPAGLNFGDCLSYAVAELSGQPLLYVGRDFAQTPIPAA